MKNDVLLKLLEELPDDLIDSAANPEPRRRPVFLRYAVPALAACLVIVIAAAIYPKLKTENPERADDPALTAVTTVQTEETAGSGDIPEAVQTVTETDPYTVHIGTAPAFPAATGTAGTAAVQTKPDGEAQNTESGDTHTETEPQNENNEHPQQQGQQHTDAPVTRQAAKTTAPNSTRARNHTTAKPVTTRSYPVTQAQQTQAPTRQTEPQIATWPAAVQTEEAATKPAVPGGDVETPGGVDGPTGSEKRITCTYTLERSAGGSGRPKDNDPNNDNTPPPTGANPPPDAEIRGNILTIRLTHPCSKAMISYLGLRDGKLTIEVLYVLTAPDDMVSRDFIVELPREYARQIWDFDTKYYEVDNIDEFDPDDNEVTLVIL